MKVFFLIAFCLAASNGEAQPPFRPLFALPLRATGVQIDGMGNLYLITESGGIQKRSARGDSLAVYSELRRWGRLHTLDVSNALQPMLFYRDYGAVVILDRFLTVRTTLNLRALGFVQPSAAALSYDNGIWLFDAVDYKLRKLDERGAVILEGPDLRLALPDPPLPSRIFEADRQLYLYDPGKGLYQFDYYGRFVRTYPIRGWSDVGVIGEHIVGIDSARLMRFHRTTAHQTPYNFPSSLGGFQRYLITPNALLTLGQDSVQGWAYPW